MSKIELSSLGSGRLRLVPGSSSYRQHRSLIIDSSCCRTKVSKVTMKGNVIILRILAFT